MSLRASSICWQRNEYELPPTSPSSHFVVADGHDMLEGVREEPPEGLGNQDLRVHVVHLVEILGIVCVGCLDQSRLQEGRWQI